MDGFGVQFGGKVVVPLDQLMGGRKKEKSRMAPRVATAVLLFTEMEQVKGNIRSSILD